MNTEQYIDHETRIRVAEQIASDTKEILRGLDSKMDSQFKWTIATIIGLFCGTFLPVFGGIMLHIAKLI
jgi:uncharacterized membrane protein YjjP (DUF1212 family)